MQVPANDQNNMPLIGPAPIQEAAPFLQDAPIPGYNPADFADENFMSLGQRRRLQIRLEFALSLFWLALAILVIAYFPQDECGPPLKYWVKVRIVHLLLFYVANIPLIYKEGPICESDRGLAHFCVKVLIFIIGGCGWLFYGIHLVENQDSAIYGGCPLGYY